MNIYNKKILASLLIISSALVLVFAACKTESAAPTSSYTITVEPRGGTGVAASYTVQDGQTVTIPDPKKDNNKFLGWCYTANGTSVDFVSGQTNIDGNKTIYALWQQTVFKVTVDGNGVPAGTYTGGTYNYGDTITAPTGNALPVKTDYEIAYWSKTKDVYSDHFEFGTSPVTSDMTLYPHWRYTIAKVRSLLDGDWLQFKEPSTIGFQLVKISSTNSYVSVCKEDPSGPDLNVDLADPAHIANLDRIKSIQINLNLGVGTNQQINGSNFDIADAGGGSFYVTITGRSFSPFCYYGASASKYNFNGYKYPDSNDITMDNFGEYEASDGITLKDYSATQFTITIANGDYIKGDYKFVKQN